MTTATKERKKRATCTGTSVTVADLKRALHAVAPAVPTRSPRPVLSNVLLHDGWMTATDLEMRIDCRIEWDGAPLLLPYQRLTAIMREVKDEQVELRPDGLSCIVKVSRGEWKLPVEDAAEFQLWEPSGLRPMPLLPADQFFRAAQSVIKATDNQSGRYALGGVLFEVSRKEGKCWLIGTDGRRLSCAEMSLPMGRDVDDAGPIVPKKVLDAIKTIADEYGSNGNGVDFESSANEIVATFDNHRVSGRLIQGKFLRWRDVFPQDRHTEDHEINIDVLKHATRAAAIVTSEQSNGVLFSFSNGMLTLTAKSSESGESKVEIEVDSYGSDGEVKLDPKFVCEVLETLPTKNGEPTVKVSIDGHGDSVLFTYGQDAEYSSVIMPLASEG